MPSRVTSPPAGGSTAPPYPAELARVAEVARRAVPDCTGVALTIRHAGRDFTFVADIPRAAAGRLASRAGSLTIPLGPDGAVRGSLVVYARSHDAFPALVAALAADGAPARVAAGLPAESRPAAAATAATLAGGSLVNLAVGILVERHRWMPAAATSHLETQAAAEGRPLPEIAADVVAAARRP